MSKDKDLWTQVRNVALTITVLSALFFVFSVGVGQTYGVITDPAQIEADAALLVSSPTNETYIEADATVATYGGSIDFVERIATVGMVLIVLGPLGLGALKARGNGSKVVDQTIMYSLPIVALIASVTMTDMMMEVIQGDRVWSNFTDSQNAWALGNAGALVAGITGWLKSRNE
jgi:hypothetical protein